MVYHRMGIQIEIGLLRDLPGGGQTSPETKFFVAVKEAVKNEGFYLTAGGIGRDYGIEGSGISCGCRNIFVEAIGVPLCLFLIGGDPEIRLKQEEYDKRRYEYEYAFNGHFQLAYKIGN